MSSSEERTGSEIAVVGLSGRFPGSPDIDTFWRNLRAGVCGLTEMSDEALAELGVSAAERADPRYVRVAGVLGGADRFDAGLFGLTPREAEVMDPQHRMFLETAWEALEDAGYDPARFPGWIGVYAGAGISKYLWMNVVRNLETLASVGVFQAMISNDKDYVATQTSYRLNLRGPAVGVQTACSTSLVAVHLACQALLCFECDLALAGGVAINLPEGHGYIYMEDGLTTPDGYCRPFDAAAKGIIRSNGVGVVALRRLADALADGDRILAVIKGSAINNDGSGKVGFTAPSVTGQSEVIAAAHAIAGVAADSISYVEAHGTGTTLGDPIEVAALTRAFHSERRGTCALGSVKGNIGHLDAAAGVTGLIKTVLSLAHREIPPSLFFETPNPKIDFANSPFYVNAALAPWLQGDGPRRAGVSAFGIGGTNVHVVVEEAPAPAPTDFPRAVHQLLPLAAASDGALREMAARLSRHLEEHPEIELADAAFTLQEGRRALAVRRAVVAAGRDEAVARLAALAASGEDGERARERIAVELALPDLGAAALPGGAELYREEGAFRTAVEEILAPLSPGLAGEVRQWLRGEGVAPTTAVASFVAQVGLARLFESWGIQPAARQAEGAAGRLAAAFLAGDLALAEALAALAAGAPAPAALRPAEPAEEERVRLALGPVKGDAAGRTVAAWGGSEALLSALGELWALGVAVDWAAVRGAGRRRRVPLPTYPFERRRYWIEGDRGVAPGEVAGVTSTTGADDAGRRPLERWFSIPSWKRALPPSLPAPEAAGKRCLIFDDGLGLGEALAAALGGQGWEVSLAAAAEDGFAAVAPGRFRLRPGDAGDYARLWEALAGGPGLPHRILHLWNVTTAPQTAEETAGAGLERALDRSFWSVFHLAQSLARLGPKLSGGVELAAFTNRLFAVDGGDRPEPVKGPLLGLCRVLPQEIDAVARCRVIDLGFAPEGRGGVVPPRLVEQALAEIAALAASGPPLPGGAVAWRGPHRWVPGLEEVDLPAATGGPAGLSPGGVYVLTGGLGGVGLEVAELLAERAQARLVLLRRRPFPAVETWDQELAGRAEDDPVARTIRRLERLRAMGAEILIAAADVADAGELAAVRERIRERFGDRIDGVFHAAGVTGGALLATRPSEQAAAVLAAKVAGTVNVARIFAEAPLLVLFSSLNSILGGIGLADYAAANAFQDAFAATRAVSHPGTTVAINWDAWQEAGMAADTDIPEDLKAMRDAQLAEAIRPEEGREALARIVAAVAGGLGQVAVSTHALARSFVQMASVRLSAALQGAPTPDANRTFHPRPALAPPYAEPEGDLEILLAGLWRELLGIEPIGRHDGFFEFGGHSLLATQATARLYNQVGVELPLQALFSYPTPALLAAALADLGVAAPAAPAPALKALPRQSRRIVASAGEVVEAAAP